MNDENERDSVQPHFDVVALALAAVDYRQGLNAMIHTIEKDELPDLLLAALDLMGSLIVLTDQGVVDGVITAAAGARSICARHSRPQDCFSGQREQSDSENCWPSVACAAWMFTAAGAFVSGHSTRRVPRSAK